MQISQTQLLALANIARLWAAELQGTPLEERSDGLLNRMRLAFVTGELSAADPAARPLQKAACDLLTALAATGRYADRTFGQALSYKIDQLKLSRCEFTYWVQEQGYPRPTFWNGSGPTVPAATTQAAKRIVNSTSQSPITANLNGHHDEEESELIDQLLDHPSKTIHECIAALNSVCDLLPGYCELLKKLGGDLAEIFRDRDLDPLKGRLYELMAEEIRELFKQMEDPKSTDREHTAALNLLSELLPMFWEAYPMDVPLKKHGREPDKDRRAPAEPNQNSAAKPPAIAIAPGERRKRQAPKRERLKAEMRAYVDAGKARPGDLLRNKESWAAQFSCGPTTAYEAARELHKELK